MADDPPRLWTVGHGRASEGEFAALLSAQGITALVDVRRYPGSRRNPQYSRGALERWLPAAGVAYRWEPGMGGRWRSPAPSDPRPPARWRSPAPSPGSPHTAIADPALRAYADHMATAEFRACLAALVTQAVAQPTAVMCAEGDWRRCHRRYLADAAVLLGSVEVCHLGHDGTVEAHQVTPEARIAGITLVYDGGQMTIAD